MNPRGKHEFVYKDKHIVSLPMKGRKEKILDKKWEKARGPQKERAWINVTISQ